VLVAKFAGREVPVRGGLQGDTYDLCGAFPEAAAGRIRVVARGAAAVTDVNQGCLFVRGGWGAWCRTGGCGFAGWSAGWRGRGMVSRGRGSLLAGGVRFSRGGGRDAGVGRVPGDFHARAPRVFLHERRVDDLPFSLPLAGAPADQKARY
jgi:hypothetical protein